LAFVNLASPHTVADLQLDPRLEVNVVDPILRNGYRFVGTGQILNDGPDYERLMDWFADERGTDYRAGARGIVLITVTDVEPLISPPTTTAAPRNRLQPIGATATGLAEPDRTVPGIIRPEGPGLTATQNPCHYE
jgi:hypothetical protein